jgi:hypothetical protein
MISENSARFGGGVRCYEVGAIISDCAISGNLATESGGGISSHCSEWSNGPTIVSCIISGNSAGTGGGVQASEGTTIGSCIILGNSALEVGGGVYCSLGQAVTSGCTIVSNLAVYAGGGVCGDLAAESMIANSVLCTGFCMKAGHEASLVQRRRAW